MQGLSKAGSPPRPWGQWLRLIIRPGLLRFTPTPVGTMSLPRLLIVDLTVHPHARGDNYSAAKRFLPMRGSPPRPWGQLGTGPPSWRCWRFTPTPVGTITACGSAMPECPVHPHARGDNA